MSKELFISSTPHETRLAIVENDALTEIYYERENEYTLAGSIYNGRVTRVLPGMQSSFVDIGLERDAFLYITDFMEEAADGAEFDSDGKATGRRDTSRPGSALPASTTEPEPKRDGRRDGGRGGRGGREQTARPVDANQREFEEGIAALDATPRAIPSAETGDVGEGEPGADGSRRWRGRRGRRRGRGDEAAPAAQVEAGSEDSGVEQLEVLVSDETPAREERPRRDRGERSSEGRERLDEVRSRFAPRGAGRGSSHGEETVDLSAQAEPFILPGESLSKYRRGEDGQPVPEAKSAGTPVAASAPSSEVEALVGWDGGAVLPGETLRGSSAAALEAAADAASIPDESKAAAVSVADATAVAAMNVVAAGNARRAAKSLLRAKRWTRPRLCSRRSARSMKSNRTARPTRRLRAWRCTRAKLKCPRKTVHQQITFRQSMSRAKTTPHRSRSIRCRRASSVCRGRRSLSSLK